MYERFYAELSSEFEQLNITPKQGAILRLASERRLNQEKIAHELCLNRNSLVTMLDELQNLGLIVREQNPENRREYHIVVTKRGRNVCAKAVEIVTEQENAYLSTLSKSERGTLLLILTELIEKSASR